MKIENVSIQVCYNYYLHVTPEQAGLNYSKWTKLFVTPNFSLYIYFR